MNFEGDPIGYIEKIEKHWYKIKALLLSIFLMIVAYYFISKLFVDFETHKNKLSYYFPLICLIVLFFLFWVISTNRFFIKLKDTLVIGILLKADENVSESVLSQRIKKAKDKIKNNFKLKTIRVVFLPVNYLQSDEDIVKYIEKKQGNIDFILMLETISGKNNGEEEIRINRIGIFGKFPKNDFKLVKSYISFEKDFNLISHHKNWTYIESNSIKDKQKLEDNLYVFILFFSSLFLILKNNFLKAFDIISQLFNKEDIVIKQENGKFPIKLKNIVAGRIATIIFDLLIGLIIDNSNKGKYDEAIKLSEKALAINIFPMYRADLYNMYIPTQIDPPFRSKLTPCSDEIDPLKLGNF